LVQGVTTALSQVKGLMQAHVEVTGPSQAPRLVGEISVERGTFKVESTGVVYSGLEGRVELQPDRIHIAQLHLRDARGQPLTVSGDLGVQGFEVGELRLAFKADDFRMLDNEMGSLRIDSDVRLGGTLAARGSRASCRLRPAGSISIRFSPA
jgi:autotransporter translocation and assembly factor TamB